MQYDVLVVGPVSLDINIDYKDTVIENVGGAVVYSGFAASKCGHKCAVFTKFNKEQCNIYDVYKDSGVDLYYKESKETCSIRNKYFTEDKERRECTSIGKCEGFTFDEIPSIDTKIYHFAGLVYGDFDEDMFIEASKKGLVAVDVQCLLRHVEEDKSMKFHDWENKKKYLPYIDFLKTDAAEAEILTGTNDREEAAKILHSWGAKEILITHNTEVIVYDGIKIYRCPIKSRNLSGRTGRGDTTFAGYITERLANDIQNSLNFATALVSLKMEKSGPFTGDREDVYNYIQEIYN